MARGHSFPSREPSWGAFATVELRSEGTVPRGGIDTIHGTKATIRTLASCPSQQVAIGTAVSQQRVLFVRDQGDQRGVVLAPYMTPWKLPSARGSPASPSGSE